MTSGALVLDPPASRLPTAQQVVVCLPTYNGRENIQRMLRALIRTLGGGARVLAIDAKMAPGIALEALRELPKLRHAARRRP